MTTRKYRFALLLSLFILLFFALSCKKENPGPDNPVPTDPAQYETPFTEIPATSDVVMYEINERAFRLSGDFAEWPH